MTCPRVWMVEVNAGRRDRFTRRNTGRLTPLTSEHHSRRRVITQPDKSKQTEKIQPQGGKSIAGGGMGRDVKDERLPGADERQGGKPFDKIRGGRT